MWKASGASPSIDDLVGSANGPSRRRQWRSRVEGKSFGMESGALKREGSRCITFPLAPCLCYYSMGAVDQPTPETFAWVGGGASPHHVNAMGRKRHP